MTTRVASLPPAATRPAAWASAAWLARLLVARPLRASAFLRRLLWTGLSLLGGVSLRLERLARAFRRPLDVARAALLLEEESTRHAQALHDLEEFQQGIEERRQKRLRILTLSPLADERAERLDTLYLADHAAIADLRATWRAPLDW